MSGRSAHARDISQSVVVTGDSNRVTLTFGNSGASLSPRHCLPSIISLRIKPRRTKGKWEPFLSRPSFKPISYAVFFRFG